MKNKWIIILAMVLALALSACSGGGVSEDATKYIATSVSMLGIEMEPGEVFEGDIVLALDENGSAKFTADGDSYNCKWEADGETFTLSQGEDEFSGTMVGDVITMVNMLDMGMDIAFLKEGATPVVATEPEEPSVSDEPAVPPAVTENENPVGAYILSGMDMDGMKLSYADVQTAEMEMILDFHQDGTADIDCFGDTLEIPIDYENKTMEIDGIGYDFTVEDDQIALVAEIEGVTMTMTFTAEGSDKWPEIEAEESTVEDGTGNLEKGTETTLSVKKLTAPSSWYGTVTISDYVGDYSYMEGTHEAWGTIGTLGDRNYFELEVPGLYNDSDIVASFYIDLDTFSFRPVVDEESWIFDLDVTEDNATWYAATLLHGLLTASLEYDSGEESFQFDYELAMIEGSDIAAETSESEG